MEIIKPNFPPRDGHTCFEYLASVQLPEQDLKNCCMKEGVVIGLYSTSSVNVRIEGTDYTNVPVYIHTDEGCRVPMLKGVEQTDAVDYFKNAALMFPLPGDTQVNGVMTKEPTVLVAVMTNPNTGARTALFVAHIIKNMFIDFHDNPESLHKTYHPYVQIDIDNSRSIYSLITGDVLQFPSWSGDEPALPFITCKNILDPSADRVTLEKFIETSIFISSPANPFSSVVKQGDSQRYMPLRDSQTGIYIDNEYITVNYDDLSLNWGVSWDANGGTRQMSNGYESSTFPLIADEGTIYKWFAMAWSYFDILYQDVVVDGGVIENRYNGYASYVATFENSKGTLTVEASGSHDDTDHPSRNPLDWYYSEHYNLEYGGKSQSFSIDVKSIYTILTPGGLYSFPEYRYDSSAIARCEAWSTSSNNHFIDGMFGFSGRIVRPIEVYAPGGSFSIADYWRFCGTPVVYSVSIMDVASSDTLVCNEFIGKINDIVADSLFSRASLNTIDPWEFQFNIEVAIFIRPFSVKEGLLL